jgi:hypothetical protein
MIARWVDAATQGDARSLVAPARGTYIARFRARASFGIVAAAHGWEASRIVRLGSYSLAILLFGSPRQGPNPCLADMPGVRSRCRNYSAPWPNLGRSVIVRA